MKGSIAFSETTDSQKKKCLPDRMFGSESIEECPLP